MKLFHTDFGSFLVLNNEAATFSSNVLSPIKTLIDDHLSPHILESSTIITYGSYGGILDMYITRTKPSICIYSFEPREPQFCVLEKNLAYNGVENVVALNNGLGRVNGNVEIVPADDMDDDDMLDLGSGNIAESNFHMVALDSLHLIACDMLVITMQGNEYNILAGGLQTLRKFRPVICFAKDTKINAIQYIHPCTKDPFDLLKKMDYTIMVVHDGLTIATPIPKSPEGESIESAIDAGKDVIPNCSKIQTFWGES